MLKLLIFLFAIGALFRCASFKRHINSAGTQKQSNAKNGRIVGGRTVDISSHPYQISLRVKFFQPDVYLYECGGSIISSTLVITAAHCILGLLPTQIHVVAGGSQQKSSDGAVVPVKEIIKHERYSWKLRVNDVALLKLATPLPLNNFTIRAIELADEEAKEGQIATVSGWGDTGGGIFADFLQEVKVPIVSNELCNRDYNPRFFVSDDMMCAGFRGVGGKDACIADSGGPLVIKDKLVGVVSWGIDCASPRYPGVYSKISYHRPWLLEKIALTKSSNISH